MKKVALVLALALLPSVAFAQNAFEGLTNIIDRAIPVVFALGVLFFLWNLAQYLFGPADNKGDAQQGMLWGIIILFVMASLFGIISVLQRTAIDASGQTGSGDIILPSVKTNVTQ